MCSGDRVSDELGLAFFLSFFFVAVALCLEDREGEARDSFEESDDKERTSGEF